MNPLVLMLRQDDPSKCTAAKLVKFGLAEQVRFAQRSSIVLDPFSKVVLSPVDSDVSESLCAVDCSWERIDEVKRLRRYFAGGIGRRLPALLAANPINYSKLGKLSTAEALAGSLYVLGEADKARAILDKFKWGHTFSELNEDLLAEYAGAQTAQDIERIEGEYFPRLPP